MAPELVEKRCTPCRGGIPPLTREEAEVYRSQAPEWALMYGSIRIERTYRFHNFRDASAFGRPNSPRRRVTIPTSAGGRIGDLRCRGNLAHSVGSASLTALVSALLKHPHPASPAFFAATSWMQHAPVSTGAEPPQHIASSKIQADCLRTFWRSAMAVTRLASAAATVAVDEPTDWPAVSSSASARSTARRYGSMSTRSETFPAARRALSPTPTSITLPATSGATLTPYAWTVACEV
jgi:hypothetical protein